MSDTSSQIALPKARARPMRSTRAIVALMLREMSTTYGRSPGGYIWAFIEPLAAIAVLSVGFSLMFRTPALGTNFQLYFASGYLPFSLAIDTGRKIAGSLKFSRSLLAYPAVRYTDAIFARLFLSLLTDIPVMALIFAGIFYVFDLPGYINYPELALSLCMAVALGLGVGVVNCTLFHAFPMWASIWAIFTRPLAIMSGVIFFIDHLARPIREVVWWNPFAHVVAQSHKAFYPTYTGEWVTPSYVFLVAAILNVVGFMLLRKYYRLMIFD